MALCYHLEGDGANSKNPPLTGDSARSLSYSEAPHSTLPFTMSTFALLTLWLVSIIASAAIGHRKGSPMGATFLGFVLGPVGLIIVLLSGSANRRPCPFCAEPILKKASVCPHCQRDVSGKPA